MEKIALNVLHEVELYSNSDLDDFSAQLFLLNKDKIQFVIDLSRAKKNESVFNFKIPETLGTFLKDPVKYKVYVYLDNARFLADEGDLQVISQDYFSGGKVVNPAKDVKFSAKIKTEDKEQASEKREPEKETKKENEQPISKKEKPVTDSAPVKKESINLDEILEQHKTISGKLNSENGKKSLREYTERLERNKQLLKNKEELNEKVKSILSSFNSK